jgi:hypothetical protein
MSSTFLPLWLAPLLALLCTSPQSTDQWELLRKVTLRAPAVQLSADNYGRIYVADASGNIDCYDSTGVWQLNYAPERLAEVSLLEARFTVRIFAFYREQQTYTLLNRFLTPIEQYTFRLPDIHFVRTACPSADNQLWLYDDGDFTIKKFNKVQNSISQRVALELILQSDADIQYMAEYQNQLFVNDRKNGVMVLDNMGTPGRTIDAQTENFHFIGDEIYFISNKKLHFRHLYNNKQQSINLPEEAGQATIIIINGKQAVLATPQALLYYRLVR